MKRREMLKAAAAAIVAGPAALEAAAQETLKADALHLYRPLPFVNPRIVGVDRYWVKTNRAAIEVARAMMTD